MEDEHEHWRKRLDGERRRILDLQAALEEQLRDEGVGPDAIAEPTPRERQWSDAGNETFESERIHGQLEDFRRELSEVDAALERLAAGSFGACEVCGTPIGAERLDAMPATRYCVQHAA